MGTSPINAYNAQLSTPASLECYLANKASVDTLIGYLNNSTFLDDIKLLFRTPSDYLVRIVRFPFNINAMGLTTTYVESIKLGTIETNVGGFKTSDLRVPLFSMGSVAIGQAFYNFMDFAPYTKIDLWLPYIGFITLSTNEVMDKTIEIKYAVDLSGGKLTAFVTANDVLIATAEGSAGVEIPYGGENAARMAREVLGLGVSTVAGAITLGVGSGAAIASAGTAKAMTAAVSGAVTGTVNLASSSGIGAVNALQPIVSKGCITNGANACYGPQTPFLTITRPRPMVPANYNTLYGRPSGQSHVLGTLTGYTEVDSVHLEGFGTATDDELNEVERLLKTGIIL